MNRKGQISTIMLFVVALGLIVAVFFSFASFKSSLELDSQKYNVLVSNINFKQKTVEVKAEDLVKRAIGPDGYQEAYFKNSLRIYSEIDRDPFFGNFYGKVINGEYVVENRQEGLYFVMNDVFVSEKYLNSEIKRTFDVEVKIE